QVPNGAPRPAVVVCAWHRGPPIRKTCATVAQSGTVVQTRALIAIRVRYSGAPTEAPMRKLIVLSLACVLVSTCTASSPPPAQTEAAARPETGARKPPRACEIVTPAEIAQALGVPEVTKDDVNSGENV